LIRAVESLLIPKGGRSLLINENNVNGRNWIIVEDPVYFPVLLEAFELIALDQQPVRKIGKAEPFV
jgi:hypothetical protein